MRWLNLQWIHPENEKVPWVFFVLFCFMGIVNIFFTFSAFFGTKGFFEIAGVTAFFSAILLFLISGLALIQLKWFALISLVIILPILFSYLSLLIYLFSRQLPIINLIIGLGVFVLPAFFSSYIFCISFSVLRDKRYSFKEKLGHSNRLIRIFFASVPFILFLLYLSAFYKW